MGFGTGRCEDYKPWLLIQDFASKGRCHRIKGMKTGRVHHLFSDLEANGFHSYDFDPNVIDIREQYPLFPVEETIEIAEHLGVKHPTDPATRQLIVMTTDFLLTIREGGGLSYLARSFKYKKDLEDLRARTRTLEKLEIERRYWKARGIDWGLVRECDIDMVLVRNVKWVRPYYRLVDLDPLTAAVIQGAAALLTLRVLEEDLPLSEIANSCDLALGLSQGRSLAIARHLLATSAWKVDMRKRIEPCEPLKLLSVNSNLIRTGGSK
jgi:hypothetical protein